MKELLKLIGIDLNFSKIIDQLKKEFTSTKEDLSTLYDKGWFSLSKYSSFFEMAKTIIENNNILSLFK